MSKTPADWPEQHRPPVEARWTNDRAEPVVIEVRTEFKYSGDSECYQGAGQPPLLVPAINAETGKARHAFSEAGIVVGRTEVHTGSGHLDQLSSLIWRACAAFGDDADVVITVARKEQQ